MKIESDANYRFDSRTNVFGFCADLLDVLRRMVLNHTIAHGFCQTRPTALTAPHELVSHPRRTRRRGSTRARHRARRARADTRCLAPVAHDAVRHPRADDRCRTCRGAPTRSTTRPRERAPQLLSY